MRVLHVVSASAPRLGGLFTVPREMARFQAKAGLEVEVYTTNVDYPTGVLDVPLGVPVYDGGVCYRYFPSEVRSLLISRALAEAVRQEISKFDIVHMHSLYRFPVTYAAWLARRRKIPYFVSPHGCLSPYVYAQSARSVLVKRLYERLFDFPNMNGASGIHYATEGERRLAAPLNFRAPVAVIPFGIDWARFASLPRPGAFRRRIGIREEPLVLFLGRLSYEKGLDLLIPAGARAIAKKPNMHLAIVGPDNAGFGKNVRRWIQEQGIAANVHLVDMLQGQELIQAFVDADVFVLPSFSENFGATVVEAMACGTPVIVSDQVNIYRDVVEAGAGIATACDIGAVEKSLMSLLEEPGRAAEMGIRGRTVAREKYDWDRVTSEMILVYQAAAEAARQERS